MNTRKTSVAISLQSPKVKNFKKLNKAIAFHTDKVYNKVDKKSIAFLFLGYSNVLIRL